MSVPDSLMYPKFQRFKSQNGDLIDGKAQLFYVNILIFNKKIVPIHRMFLLGIRETVPPMSVLMQCFIFYF